MVTAEMQSESVSTETAIPIEYRYRTGLAATLCGGLALVGVMVLFGSGTTGLMLALLGLGATALGMMGLLADPHGFIYSVGKRLIITDEALQEVDEKGQVRWFIRPSEIKRVNSFPGRRVMPLTGRNEWRAEVWTLELSDGRIIRIPVWLLPGRGQRFKQRFDTFLTFARTRAGHADGRATT